MIGLLAWDRVFRFLKMTLCLLGFGISLGLLACGGSEESELQVALGDAPSASHETDALELSALKGIVTVPVDGVVGPGGHEFFTADRTEALDFYPCAGCHDQPTPATSSGMSPAHANIQAVHPSTTQASCVTCHSQSNPAELRVQSGETVGLNQAYTLCAGCHFQQGESWAGGAHGKRLVGWAGKRVVANCTSCHNPHSPAFEKRAPVQFPTLPDRPLRAPGAAHGADAEGGAGTGDEGHS